MRKQKHTITFEDEDLSPAPFANSSNRPQTTTGAIKVNGETVGLFRGVYFQLGEYPNEEYFGEYRTANSCRKAAVKEIKERLKDGRINLCRSCGKIIPIGCVICDNCPSRN